MSVTQHFDQSTFQAMRVREAEILGPPVVPVHVVVPGAKTAIAHDELMSLQSQGKTDVEIVTHINTRWRDENAHRISRHEEWVSDAYLPALEQIREAHQRAAAEELRRRAVFEQIMNERAGE